MSDKNVSDMTDDEIRAMAGATPDRIRWEQPALNNFYGYLAGATDSPTFTIWEPKSDDDQWLLTSRLPAQIRRRLWDDRPQALQAEAERWLEEFVSSLGEVFPDEPERPSRAWHADWAKVDRDSSGNAILRHKPTGGMYKILPVEECRPMTETDPVAAALAEIRERAGVAAAMDVDVLSAFSGVSVGGVIAASAVDVPRLLAAVEAALNLAGKLEPQGPPSSALEEDRMWVRQECADMIREAIGAALAGKEDTPQ